MRQLVPPSLLILALVVLMNARAGVYEGLLPAGAAEVDPDAQATSVRIFSQGGGRKPVFYGRRRQLQSTIINGDIRTHPLGEPGLRVATFLVDSEQPNYDNFDLAHSAEDVARFAQHVRDAPVGAILAMGVHRSIKATKELSDQTPVVSATLEQLGATAQPETLTNPSWAFLCIRRPDGWRPLAESLSMTQGVMLAYQIPGDLSGIDEVRPELLIEGSDPIYLVRTRPVGEKRTSPFVFSRRGFGSAFAINGVERDAIFATPPHGPEAEGLEELETGLPFYARLGPRAVLHVDLGLMSYHRPHSDGCQFRVFVNGELAGSHDIAVDPDELDAWIPWTVDLSKWENQWAMLELVTVRHGLEPGEIPPWAEPCLWGNPTIVSQDPQGEGVPEPNGWELFLAVLDKDGDGVLLPEESRERLRSLDVDGDGKIVEDDWPEFAKWVADVIDTSGDGVVDMTEADAFYGRLVDLY